MIKKWLIVVALGLALGALALLPGGAGSAQAGDVPGTTQCGPSQTCW